MSEVCLLPRPSYSRGRACKAQSQHKHCRKNGFPKAFAILWQIFLKLVRRNREPCLEPLGNLAWEPLPENLPEPCLGTSCGEPLLGNLFLVTLLGNLAVNLCLGALLGNLAWNLFLGTLLGNHLLGTLAWEPVPGNLLGAVLGNLFLGTLLGNLAWEPLPGNLAWEPLPGNPVPNLAPCGFGWSEGFSWKRKPFLGTRFPTLCRADLAAPTCSGTFTLAEDPKLTLLGKNAPERRGRKAGTSWNGDRRVESMAWQGLRLGVG